MSPKYRRSTATLGVAILTLAAGMGAATCQIVTPPTNLRVLPKNSTPTEIRSQMELYGAELGVSCDYCHVRDPKTQRLDYAADDNPAKQRARVMITMLNEMNDKYLAQLDDPKYAVRVSCGNCHRGRTDPPEFEPRMWISGGG